MEKEQTKALIKHFETFLTDSKIKLFNDICNQRTRYLTIVLEDIYQPHNASAVLRSADCFGIQDVHIIENENEYNINPDVALGASKWLDLYFYNKQQHNSLAAIQSLKKKGYRVVATSPGKHDVNLENFDLTTGPVALVFGAELCGISAIVEENADEFLKIPMYGFTESFNISVSAAVIMHHLTLQMRTSDIKWQLTQQEHDQIKLEWMRRQIKHAHLIEKRFLNG